MQLHLKIHRKIPTKDKLHTLLTNHTLKRKIELQRASHKIYDIDGEYYYGYHY